MQFLPWPGSCIRFTVYFFVPYFTPCPLQYKIFIDRFPQNAAFLSNLLGKVLADCFFVGRGVVLFGRPGPAALLLSLLCPASVFSEPAVFFLESKDKEQDFILLPFHSNHLFLIRI